MVKIEVGKSYRTRDGRKAACLRIGSCDIADLRTETQIICVWADNGLHVRGQRNPCDIISEWQDDEPQSPVHERVIREIVPGTYGNLTIYYAGDSLHMEMTTSVHTPTELRDMAKMLLDIADVLEENE